MKMGVLGYLERDGKVLFLHRTKKVNDMHEGLFVAPGGHIEYNESPYEALVREIKEETGFTVEEAQLKILLTFPEDGDSPFGDLWYGYVFYISRFSGELIECDEGDLLWVDKDKIKDLLTWEGDKIFNPLVFDNKRYDIVLNYKSGKLISHKISQI